MPITVPNAVVETFSATEQASHSVNLPSFNAGDVIIVCVNHSPNGTAAIGSINTPPSGWTELGTATPTGAASDSLLSIWRRVMQGGDGSSISFGTTTSMTIGAIATGYRGVDQTTPEDQTTPTMNTGTNGPVCPSITTQTADAWVIHCAIQDATTNSFTDGSIPSIDTLRGTMANNPPSNGMNLGMSDNEQASIGASGTATYSTTSTEEYVGATIALRPVAVERTMDGYRFYDDDAAPGSETALAGEDSNISRERLDPLHIRIQTDMDGDAPDEGLKLFYKETGDGVSEWREVPT